MHKAINTSLIICLILVADVSGQQLQFVGSYNTQFLTCVHIENNLCFIIDGQVLSILDVSSHELPILLGGVSIPGDPQKIDIMSNYAFVAAGDSGMQVVDISNLAHPTIVGSFPSTYYVNDLIVEDSVCYLACNHMFKILNISNPISPTQISELFLNSYFNSSLDKKGENIFYFADYGEFTFVEELNVADRLNPHQTDTGGTGYCIRDLLAYGNNLFAGSDCWNTLYSYDISIPDSIIGYHYFSFPAPTALAAGYGFLFMALHQGAVSIIDYSNPDSCRQVGFYDTPGSSNDIAISGIYLYVSDSSSIQILKYLSPNSCAYLPGDINGNGSTNGTDVSYAVNYFKGGQLPPIDCHPACANQPNPFFAAGDINGSCAFNGVDITYFVRYLQGGPELTFCPDCPPN
jgi:hypothetical protein